MKFLTTFLTLLLLSCNLTKIEETGKKPEPQSTVAVTRSKLYDANNVFIGYVTSLEEVKIQIVTEKGYLLSLKWDGSIFEHVTYYNSNNGIDKPFDYFETAPTAKQVKYNELEGLLIYMADSYGLALPNTNITTTDFEYNKTTGQKEVYNEDITAYGYNAYELVPTAKAEIGLPAVITTPIDIVFE